MSLNPNDDANDITTPAQRIVATEAATVVSAPSHTAGDDIAHEVKVSPDTTNTSFAADILVDALGDTVVPEEGTRVLVGYRIDEQPTILGIRYGENDTIPDYEPGDRRIGHPTSDSYVRLKSDGTIHAENDNGTTFELQPSGDVVIDGGSTKAIVDATISTTTDADGHVTDVTLSLTRSPNVYLPQ